MAALFKRGDWYYLSFYNSQQRPKRKQVPLKTKTKRTAEQLQRRLEDAYALGEYSLRETSGCARSATTGRSRRVRALD